MSQLTLDEWKMFLKARVAQESGKDEAALKVFDELLGAHPNNPHLIASRTFALARLGQSDEAAASAIDAKYSVLGATLVGERDDPKKWNASLKEIMSDVDDFKAGRTSAAALVLW